MTDTLKFVVGAVVSVVYVGALVALTWHGSITGDQALTAAGAVILPLVGAAVHSNGVSAGTDAAIKAK